MANSNNDQGNTGRGGDHATHEQHVKGGEHSHKDTDKTKDAKPGSGNETRGGSSEQHAKAGSESHKNK